jgi:hypothetical protein
MRVAGVGFHAPGVDAAWSRKAGGATCEGGPAAILHGPAPQCAFGARVDRPFGAIGFSTRSDGAIRSHNRAHSGTAAATSAADAGTEPAGRDFAASANPDGGAASRSGADGGFPGSIPARRRHGQPALLRAADRPGSACGQREGLRR